MDISSITASIKKKKKACIFDTPRARIRPSPRVTKTWGGVDRQDCNLVQL